MNTSNTTMLTGSLCSQGVLQLAQGKKDAGLKIGSETHLIGSTEGFIGNRLPATT